MSANKLVGVAVAAFTVITSLTFLASSSDRRGMIWPLVLICFILVCIAIAPLIHSKRNRKTLANPQLLSSAPLGFFFIPGSEFFSKDMRKALERENADEVSKAAIVLLVIIVFGNSFLSFSAILTGVIPWLKDWDTMEDIPRLIVAYFLGCFFYVAFTVLINFLVRLSINLAYKAKITEQIESLILYFDILPSQGRTTVDKAEFWRELSQKLEHVYGHKTWGGPKMYNLLQQIQERKAQMGTSQWFLLQFASDTLDHHVLGDHVGIRFRYNDDSQYPKFLADTMGYCSKSMVWIVDKNDFCQRLFPGMIREVILSITSHLVYISQPKNQILHNLQSLDKTYAKEKEVSPYSEDLCRLCKSNNRNKCGKCKTWDDVLDRYIGEWANAEVSKAIGMIINVSHKSITDLCDIRKSDRFPYPHLRKFYDHAVPKARIIAIDYHDGWTTGSPDVRSREVLTEIYNHVIGNGMRESDYVDGLAEYFVTTPLPCLKDNEPDSESIRAQKKQARRHVFLQAWRLFKYFSDSKPNHTVGFAMVARMVNRGPAEIRDILMGQAYNNEQETGELYLDLGVYDQCVMVNSKPYGENSREVQWSILPEGLKPFDSLDPRLQSHEDVLLIEDFIDFMEKAANGNDNE